jgi:hypothetical protein
MFGLILLLTWFKSLVMWHFFTRQLVSDVLRGPSAIIFRAKQLKNDSVCSSHTASHWKWRHNVPLKCLRAVSRMTQNLIPDDMNRQHHDHENLKSQCHISLKADYCLYLWFSSEMSGADSSNLHLQIPKPVTLHTAHCVTFCHKSQDCNSDKNVWFQVSIIKRSELHSAGLLCSKQQYFCTEVSGQPVGPICNGQNPKCC